MTRYQRVVFLQGEDAEEALGVLDESGEPAAIEYLSQWDMEPGEEFDEPASGDDDDVYEDDHYRLSYNTRLGYIGLEAIVND